jgi:hypothetical protein
VVFSSVFGAETSCLQAEEEAPPPLIRIVEQFKDMLRSSPLGQVLLSQVNVSLAEVI